MDQFCDLACLTYTEDGPALWAQAQQLLRDNPGLTSENIWAAAAAADADAVRALLAKRPESASEPGGPRGWPPLLYLTYSRIPMSRGATRDIAMALLEAGADPDAGFLWHEDLPSPFTALTGAFGEGEQGPGRCPPHEHGMELARLLLDAGADANDGQALYNRMFSPGNDHLRLLFEYGLGGAQAGPWPQRLGDALENPAQMLERQRVWASMHGFAERLELLRVHGVDINAPLPHGQSPVDFAAHNGDRAAVAAHVAAGATPPELTGVEAFVAAALADDRAEVDRLREHLDTALATRPDLLWWAAEHGRAQSIPLLIELGFSPNALGESRESVLHWATGHSAPPDLIEILLAAGADPDCRDARFNATPIEWAHWQHNERAVAAFGRAQRSSIR